MLGWWETTCNAHWVVFLTLAWWLPWLGRGWVRESPGPGPRRCQCLLDSSALLVVFVERGLCVALVSCLKLTDRFVQGLMVISFEMLGKAYPLEPQCPPQ